MAGRDGVHDLPVDRLVAVDREVAKADGLLHPQRELRADMSQFGEQVEGLSRRMRGRSLAVGDEVGADVDAKLDSPRQIQGYDVLSVRVLGNLGRAVRALVFDPPQAAANGFQLLKDYIPIQAWRLSCRMRRTYGMKSASSKRCRLMRSA